MNVCKYNFGYLSTAGGGGAVAIAPLNDMGSRSKISRCGEQGLWTGIVIVMVIF